MNIARDTAQNPEWGMESTSPEPLPLVDIDAALPRFYFDRQFFIDMFGEFISILPTQISDLKAAIQKEDIEGLAHLAHDLKGSAANFSANTLRALALELEQAGKANNLEEAQSLIAQMDEQVARLSEYLEKLRG
jgi:HPt (histidine-containing phosphotransfer) domain-containing protein